MNAKAMTTAHYRAVEDHARDVDKARIVIHDLRMELHEVIADIQCLVLKLRAENDAWDRIIARAKATLLRTLPGGELDELDAMTPVQRRETLSDAITGMFGVKARP